jgi:hypothetical protein
MLREFVLNAASVLGVTNSAQRVNEIEPSSLAGLAPTIMHSSVAVPVTPVIDVVIMPALFVVESKENPVIAIS